MNPRLCAALLMFSFLLSAVGLTWAQPAPDTPKQTAPAVGGEKADKDTKKKDQVPPKGESSDPTSPSPKLKELLNPERFGKSTGSGPVSRMPVLGLRGRVVAKDQPAVALLDVDGKVFLIGKGSSLPGGGNTMLRVVEITSWEVRIEVLPFKEIIILR